MVTTRELGGYKSHQLNKGHLPLDKMGLLSDNVSVHSLVEQGPALMVDILIRIVFAVAFIPFFRFDA